jgi:hypothetical protein
LPLALGLAACDVARPEPERGQGPDVHVIDAFPSDGCGLGKSTCVMPTNGTIALRFDRFLNPATVNRQAIRVYTGDPDILGGPLFGVSYDPVERVVELRVASGGYAPQTLYHYELLVPSAPGDGGIRAFDGAPLAEAGIPLRGTFFTADSGVEMPPVATAPSCADIVEHVFSAELGACATARCHRSSGNFGNGTDLGGAPYGLWLDSRANLRVTAVDRVARETELGDVSGGLPDQNAERFGVRMPLIAPKNPGNSYLLYKLLYKPENFAPCPASGRGPFCTDDDPRVSTHPDLPLAKHQSVVPAAEEVQRLREWFVKGEGMPLDPDGRGLSVGLGGLRAVASFIAAGADCR